MRWVRHLHLWVTGMVCLWVLPLQAGDQYRITGVASSDSLNIRAEPGVKSSIVAKAPHDGSGIVLEGGSQQIGKTNWVKITWQGHTGWVSKAYLQLVPEQVGQSDKSADGPTSEQEAPTKVLTETQQKDKTASAEPATKATETEASATAAEKTKPLPEPTETLQKEKISGMWILECGNMSPFWKVEVLPEWISGTLGKHKTGMPIKHKQQEHGKYRNIALKTEVKGANRWNRLELTLTYNKSCFSTLTRQRVAFDVTGTFNGEVIEGCCRALQVK